MYTHGIRGERYQIISHIGEDLTKWTRVLGTEDSGPCTLEQQKNMSHSLIGIARAPLAPPEQVTVLGLVSLTRLKPFFAWSNGH